MARLLNVTSFRPTWIWLKAWSAAGSVICFRSSAHPRRVLSYLGRVDLQKHLSYRTSRVCWKTKMFFSTEVWIPKHFGLHKLSWVLGSLRTFFSRWLTRFYLCFPRISCSVVLVKTGIHVPYMEMMTLFETKLQLKTKRLPLWQVLWQCSGKHYEKSYEEFY